MKRVIYADDISTLIRDDPHIRGSSFARVMHHIKECQTVSKIINLDEEKPNHIPQELWDGLKEAFDKIYEDESEE